MGVQLIRQKAPEAEASNFMGRDRYEITAMATRASGCTRPRDHRGGSFLWCTACASAPPIYSNGSSARVDAAPKSFYDSLPRQATCRWSSPCWSMLRKDGGGPDEALPGVTSATNRSGSVKHLGKPESRAFGSLKINENLNLLYGGYANSFLQENRT